jgi:hypothetical protein
LNQGSIFLPMQRISTIPVSSSVSRGGGAWGLKHPPLFSCIIYKLIKLDNVVNVKKLN